MKERYSPLVKYGKYQQSACLGEVKPNLPKAVGCGSYEATIADFLEEIRGKISRGEITYDQAPQQYKNRVGKS